MGDMLVVRSKIKDITKLNVAGDFAEALSKVVDAKVKRAEERAVANGRKTLKPQDL